MKKRTTYFLRFFVFITILFFGIDAKAMYVYFDTVYVSQPNGEELQLFVTGDEYFHRLHDKAGYSIMLDQDGYYYYASGMEGEKWISSGYKVGKINPESIQLKKWIGISPEIYKQKILEQKSVDVVEGKKMTNGSSTAVIIFVKFADQSDFTETFYNQIDSNFNAVTQYSVYGYWDEVSYNKLFINGHLIKAIYTAPQKRSYFLPYNATTNPEGYKDNEKGTRRGQLLKDAAAYVKDMLPADVPIDMNEDGKIDFFAYIIKGNAGAWGDLLWPHKSSVSFTQNINGKKIGNYVFLTENMSTNGTINHEFFHMMGAPDLYRYSNTEIDPAPMSFADSNVHPSAYMKWKHSDATWVKEIPSITQPGTVTLFPLFNTDASGAEKCAVSIPSPFSEKEYFVVEYRKKGGSYERGVNPSGLTINRINPTVNGNGGGPPDELYVYRKNGTTFKNGDKSSKMFYSGSSLTSINDATNPSSFMLDMSYGGLNIKNIGDAGSSISFDVSFETSLPLVSGTMYRFVNKASGMVLALNEGNIEVASKQNNTSSQIWLVNYIGNGKWDFLSKQNGKAITIENESTVAGTNAIASTFNGSNGQKYYFIPNGDGYFYITTSLDNKVLQSNSSGTGNVVQQPSGSSTNQLWKPEKIEILLTPTAEYSLISAFNSTAAEVYSSNMSIGANVVQWRFNSKRNNQIWKLVPVEENKYKLKAKHSSLCIAANANGDIIQTSEQNGIVWNLIDLSNGNIMLTDQITGKALAVTTGNFENGSKLVLQDAKSGERAQEFLLMSVNGVDFDSADMVVAAFESKKSAVLEGDTVLFVNNSLNNPTRLYWDFEGGQVINDFGDSVQVVYKVPGVWNVKLTAQNSKSKDVKVKENYITVLRSPSGNALVFDGNDDYITPKSLKDTALTEFTVEYWLNPAHLSDYNQVIGNSDLTGKPFQICANRSGGLHFAAQSPRRIILKADNVLEAGKWVHIAGVFKDMEASIFVNGEKKATSRGMATSIDGWDQFSIGVNNGFTFDGMVDEIRIWKKALTVTEINENINHQLLDKTKYPDLWFYYNFDGSGFSDVTFNNIDIEEGIKESGAFAKDEYRGLPTISLVGLPAKILVNQDAFFECEIGNSNFVTWRIFGADTMLAYGKNPKLKFARKGEYSYTATAYNSNGIKTISGIFRVADLNDSVDKIKPQLNIYGNSGIINLSSDKPISKVNLFTVTGEKIYSSVVNSTFVSIDNLKSGLYIVEVYAENDRSVLKYIVH